MDDEKRARQISIMVTPTQLEQIEAAAAAIGETTAGFVRRQVLTSLARQHFDRLMSA